MKGLNYYRTILLCILVSSCSIHKDIARVDFHNQDYSGYLEKHLYECTYSTPIRGQMYVYLPKSYYGSDERYPVLYLLHGANGNEASWMEKGNILVQIDSLTECGEIRECIYVFPNMNQYDNYYDHFVSSETRSIKAYFSLNGNVESTFVDDVVRYVDERFRTISDKDYRAICGLSLGGLHTIYITADRPDMFGYVGLFSPLVHPPLILKYGDDIYSRLDTKLSLQFQHSPSIYWILIGEEDMFYRSAFRFGERLRKQGYRSEFLTTSGGHDWRNWQKYTIHFLKHLWQKQ